MTKTALISGGTSGIGKAIVLRLLEIGYQVATFAPGRAAVRSLDKELQRAYPKRARAFYGDVTKESSIAAVVQKTIREFGQIDVLVNNAGIGYYAESDELDMQAFQRMVEVNLIGASLLTKHAVAHMKRRGAGQIIFIASSWGLSSAPRKAMYSATKFGIRGFAAGLRAELVSSGIKVATINPGKVDTPWNRKISAKERHRRKKEQHGKRQVMMQADDVADVVGIIARQSASASIEDVTLMPFPEKG